MPDPDLEMILLENAFDFLDEAAIRLKRAKGASTRDYKYAILHLSSGIELLLKQRLYNEHRSLIFKDVNNANKEKLDDGDFDSTSARVARNRLKNVCQIEFSAQHEEILETLRKERNKIEHYHVSVEKAQAISLLVKTWSFIVDFVAHELKLDWNSNWQFQNVLETVESLKNT